MNPLLDRFQKLPRSQRWLLAGLVYILIMVAFWFSLISPTRADIVAAQAKTSDLVKSRNAVRARAENRAAFEARLETLAARLKKALRELPNDREIPGLLSEIDSLARKSGLDVRKFQPLPEIVHEFYAEVPVQIIMDGGYHEFGIFFDRVRNMNRIVSARDIKMGDPVEGQSEVTLTVSGRIVTYRFLSEEEIKANAERQKAAKPRPAAKGGEE